MTGLGAALKPLVGQAAATALSAQLEIVTVGELLRHYPRRYAERGKLTDLANLQLGEHVTVLAEIRSVSQRPMRVRSSEGARAPRSACARRRPASPSVIDVQSPVSTAVSPCSVCSRLKSAAASML